MVSRMISTNPTRLRLAARFAAGPVVALAALALGPGWQGALAAGPTACVVNTISDEVNAGSGTCDSTAGVGKVSLRSAIEAFNASGNTGSITFNLPANSVITLTNGELHMTNGNVTITGPGARLLAVDGNKLDRVFHVGNHGDGNEVTAKISGITIQNGNTTSKADYPAYSGGGIYNDNGVLTIDGVTITNNAASWGAAIDQEGQVTVTNSTFSNNVISGDSCGGSAMEVEADFTHSGTAFVNVTITGNDSGACSGTLRVQDANTFTNVTISGNKGAGGALQAEAATFANSIIANQTGSADCATAPTDGGSNLSSDASCGFAAGSPTFDLVSTDPGLGALANNGGPTDTMALTSSSPPVDAVHNICPPPAADQRGVPRPRGAACDIGAFEFSPLSVVSASSSCGDSGGGGPVTISGSGFLQATTVTFGGKPALSFTIVSDSQINAIAPPGSGTAPIIVTTPSGTSPVTATSLCAYAAAAPTLPAAGYGAGPSPSPLLAGALLVVTAALGGLALVRRRR
jgi:IPT/TIG domain